MIEEQIDKTAVLILSTIFRLTIVILAAMALVKFVLPFLTKQVARYAGLKVSLTVLLSQVPLSSFSVTDGLHECPSVRYW